MFDKFDNIGKIILVKNIVFTNKENIKVADHSALKGRPCIIITETEDKMYLLPCCTSGDKYKKYKMVVKPTDTLDRRWHKESYVSLNSVIEMNIFFNTSYAELTPLAYYKLLKNVINFFNRIMMI